jgi:hypothetical protein
MGASDTPTGTPNEHRTGRERHSHGERPMSVELGASDTPAGTPDGGCRIARHDARDHSHSLLDREALD